MAAEPTLSTWKQRWETKNIPFHSPNVHRMLEKHFDKIDSDGQVKKVFIPMCGKTVDMKWLLDKGYDVVSVEIAYIALQEFFAEQNLKYTEEECPTLNKDARLLQTEDRKLKLYSADVLCFNDSVEGTFDAVWDRGGLGSIARSDIPRYVEMLKSIVRPGGRILCEVMEFDTELGKEHKGKFTIPPPYPMFKEDLQKLFGPDFTVNFVENFDHTIVTVPAKANIYILKKKED